MKQMKRLGLILATLFTFIFLGNLSVYAQEDDENIGNATVTVSYIYESDNVTYEISKTGGVLIGTKAGGANQVISCLDNVVLSDDEKTNLCNSCNIKPEDVDKVKPVIKVSLNDVELDFMATEATRSEELNLVVLNLSQSVRGSDYAVFNLEKDAYRKKQDVILYDLQGRKYDGKLGNTIENSSNLYLEYSLSEDIYTDGCGIYNKDGEFLGLCQENNRIGQNVAISADSIAGILDHINVDYEVADHEDYSGKAKELEGMLEIWKKRTLIFFIATIVFLVATIVLTIYIIVDKKKRKKLAREKEEIEKKKAPKNHEPYNPNTVNANDYVQGINLAGFAPSSKKIEMNLEDTNVLQNSEKKLIFVNEHKQYQIEINTFPAVIGKDKKQSDYEILNPMISRKHLSVYHNNGRYQIVDLNSKNGTFLNGKRLAPATGYDIHAGDELVLANERFRVCIK